MNIDSGSISASEAYGLLQREGYPRAYVEKLLPTWWDNALLKTGAGILQFALFAKQRLGLELHFDHDGKLSIADDPVAVRFKHRKDTSADELHISKRIGKAAAELASYVASDYVPLPTNPTELRNYILSKTKGAITFQSLLEVCWDHGIPVLFLEALPNKTKRMTGMIVNYASRPAILLGLRTQQHARQLFILAHEIAHLQLGHVIADSVLIDQDLDSAFDTLDGELGTSKDNEEKDADTYALKLIRGAESIRFDNSHFGEPSSLVVFSVRKGKELNVDPGHIILSYAFETHDWPFANQALNYLEGTRGALQLIKEMYFRHADMQLLGEEGRDHLLKIQGYGS
jgi:Zn-dependent peptidase ImmA (M78 family)